MQFSRCLVGSSGLEPPTSRLSGVRSNLLSYEPSFSYSPSTRGGDERVRTDDPLLAKQVLSQLSYTPTVYRLSSCALLKVRLRTFKTIQYIASITPSELQAVLRSVIRSVTLLCTP